MSKNTGDDIKRGGGKILLGLMTIKLKDERKHLDNMKRGREKVRQWIKSLVGGSRTYETIMKNLRYEMKRKRKETKREIYSQRKLREGEFRLWDNKKEKQR